jgi:twitching motility protein PilT
VAAIDKLLEALAAKEMDCLVLEPSRRPCLRKGDVDYEVTKTPLDGTLIDRLLQEVSPPGESPDSNTGGRWEFDYAVGRKVFRFFGLRGPKGWLISVTHDPTAVAPEPPPETTRLDPYPPAIGFAESMLPTAPAPDLGPAPAAAPLRPPAAVPPLSEPPAVTTRPGTGPASHAESGPASGPVRVAAAPASPPFVPASPSLEAQEIPDIKSVLIEVIGRGASDLHLSSAQPPYLRVDGELEPLTTWKSPEPERLERLLAEILPKGNREELEARNQTDFGYELEGKGRFRVNVYRERRGIGAAFRLIPQRILSLEQLGLPERAGDLAQLRRGLVLVTGATGSGKTTTLAAFVDRINRTRPDHLLTIEDPIEFVHPSIQCLVHQRQIGLHADSFADALRAALREDPDVVMVGELRDLETTSIALRTAETGHLVLGTLHTTSAAATIERLVDQYPADQQPQVRMMLAGSLRAVISQTLLKRAGGGRVAAFELLLATPAVASMIRENKTFQLPTVMQTGRRIGMRRLDEALLQLVETGVAEPEEAYRHANDKADFLTRLRALGVDTSFNGGGQDFHAAEE